MCVHVCEHSLNRSDLCTDLPPYKRQRGEEELDWEWWDVGRECRHTQEQQKDWL